MAQKRIHKIMSFEGGMVERPTSETDYAETMLKWQVPQGRSALYVENFDPAIVTGALTKRKGMALVRDRVWTTPVGLEATTGAPAGFSQTAVIYADLERWTLLLDRDPETAGPTPDTTDKVTFLGCMDVDYNKPAQQSIDIVFLRDIEDVGVTDQERTRVVARCKTTQTGTMTWMEPHINGGAGHTGSLRTSSNPATYPGWEVSGTLADVARHGGTVLFATNVARELWPASAGFDWSVSWVDELYPCYVWTYWDLRRKRKDDREFWNIRDAAGGTGSVTVLNDLTDNYTTDDKYSLFKVLTPSLYVNRSNLVRFFNYTYDLSPSTGDMRTGGYVETNMNSFLTTTPPIATPIEIAILECVGRTFTPSRPVIAAPAEGLLPESDAELTPTTSYTYLNEDRVFISSIETPKVSFQAPDQAVQNKYLKGELAGGGVHNSNITGTYFGWVTRTGYLEDTINKTRRNVKILVAPGHTFIKDEPGKENEDYTAYLPVELPDYLTNQNPRYWLQGEKIPLVVTLKLRGVEVVAGSHLYNVGIANPKPNASLFSGQVAYANTGNTKAFPSGQQHNYTWNHYYAWREQSLLAEEKALLFDGNPLVPVLNSGWYFNTDAGGADPRWNPYDSHYSYSYEPFNPTQQPPFVSDPADAYANKYYTSPIGYDSSDASHQIDNESPGYRRRTTKGTMVYVAVKIRKDAVGAMLEMGLETINVYAAQPGDTSILRSKGTRVIEDPDQGVYMFPKTEDLEEYSQYSLIKSFVLDGDGTPFADYNDVTRWKERYYGTPVATNAWLEQTNHIISCGQDKDGTPNGHLTPDFAIWDYPVTKSLSLNSSGKYWQGRGASVITSIKGRTFLGGCIDQYGELEQGIIRYSDIQSGVISLDVFSDEGFIKLGGQPHTAFTEFREQLWAFSREEVYRMQMPSITDTTTWEYLDKYSGLGTISPKTVISIPHGVFWLNESGVWASDGRDPRNIALPVLTTYQKMATSHPPYYATKFDLPEFPYGDDGTNPYLEISYDEETNEIVVTSPTMTGVSTGDNGPNLDSQNPNTEFRLVYSLDMQTWHIETYDLPTFDTTLNEFDENGSYTF